MDDRSGLTFTIIVFPQNKYQLLVQQARKCSCPCCRNSVSATQSFTTFTTPTRNCKCTFTSHSYALIPLTNSTSTAKLLATYTINLVLVMHNIFTTASPSDPPRVLSTNLVSSVLKRHKTYLEKEPLDNIDSAREFTRKPEEVIAAVIRKRLSQNSKGLVSGVGYS